MTFFIYLLMFWHGWFVCWLSDVQSKNQSVTWKKFATGFAEHWSNTLYKSSEKQKLKIVCLSPLGIYHGGKGLFHKMRVILSYIPQIVPILVHHQASWPWSGGRAKNAASRVETSGKRGTLQGLRKSGLRDILVDLFAKFVFFCLVFDVVLDSRTATLALCPASQTGMRRMCLKVVDVVPWKPKFCFRHLTRVLSHNFWEEVRKLAIPIRLVCSHLEVIMQVRKPTRWAKHLGKICLWKRSKRT